MSYDIFHLAVHFLMFQVLFPGCPYDGIGHGMGKVFFHTGRDPEHLCGIMAAERNHPGHCGTGIGQGTGLVKDDGIRGGDLLQEFAALDGDLIETGFPHGGKYAQRHGEFESTGEIHHEDGNGPCQISGQKPGQDAAAQAPGDQGIRQARSPCFRIGFELLRILDHADDLIIFAAARGLCDFQDAVSFFYYGTGIDSHAGRLGSRHGLACQRGLAYHDVPLFQDTVQRNDVTGIDLDQIPLQDLCQGNQDRSFALPVEPDLVHIQGHASCQVIHGFLMGPLVQIVAQL